MTDGQTGETDVWKDGPIIDAKVMVVDSDRFSRKAVRASLENEGYKMIIEAESGCRAVALSGEFKPDVVVMDYDVGDMDGAEVARAIK